MLLRTSLFVWSQIIRAHRKGQAQLREALRLLSTDSVFTTADNYQVHSTDEKTETQGERGSDLPRVMQSVSSRAGIPTQGIWSQSQHLEALG